MTTLAKRRRLGVPMAVAGAAFALSALSVPPADLAQAATAVTSVAPLVGVAATPTGHGYWQAASDGGVFAFGDAGFYGSMGGKPLNKPVVGIAATPSGHGYWQVASDGGVFAFGDAGFHGSMGGKPLNGPVVGLAATPKGDGYWEVAADGGVFAFGGAPFKGSMGGSPLNSPLTGIAGTPSGQGYWLVGADGGVFAYGDAPFKGSMGGQRLAGAVNAITRTPAGDGYWLSAVDGGIFAFGTAGYAGRATYTPPTPIATTTGQKVADLAIGWRGYTYTGVNNDRWNAAAIEYWCADFQTYTWQHAGIAIPHYAGVSNVHTWATQNHRFSTDIAHPHIGDAVIYGSQHVGIVVQIFSNGSVTSIDGDFGGQRRSSQVTFAKTSHVVTNTWQPSTGVGAGGMSISGYVTAG